MQERLFMKIYVRLFMAYAAGILISVAAFASELIWKAAEKRTVEGCCDPDCNCSNSKMRRSVMSV